MPRKPQVDIVGTKEIAKRLGVNEATVRHWRSNRPELEFPDPDWTVSGNPAWWWPTVKKWAKARGRLPD